MATIAFGVAGAVIGGMMGNPQLGWAIGTTIGGALFGPRPPDVERGRLSDLRIQGASYGSAIPLVFGTHRIAGTVLWTSGLREHVSSSRSGGKGGGGQRTNSYTYDVDIAILLCAGPIIRVNRIWANAELIYDYNAGTQQGYDLTDSTDIWTSDGLRVYKGTTTQLQDSLVQAAVDAAEGAGSTPAYRGRAYAVFEAFSLDKFGGNLPNFSFEVVQASSPSLESVLTSLVGLVGVDAGDTDFSAVGGVAVRGLVVPSRSPVRQTIESLQTAYHFDMVEVDGTLTAVLRAGQTPVAVPASDVGARMGAGGDQPRVKLVRQQVAELPRQVDVVYSSASNAYQSATQTALRQTGNSEDLKTISLPLVLTDDEARTIAEIELYQAWQRQIGVTLSLPWKWMRLTPGDVLTLPDVAGQDRDIRIESIVAGMPGILEITGNPYDDALYTQGVSGAVGPSAPSQTVGIVPTAWKAFSAPQLRDSDGTKPGFYVAATGASGWQGGTIYYSRDGGTTYLPGPQVTARSVIGEAVSALADGVTAGALDAVNDVDIELDSSFPLATLENATAAEIDGGQNVAVIGAELVGIETATLTGPLAYTLSNLIRGLRSSDMTGHGSSEIFVLATSAIVLVQLPDSAVGETVRVKVVSPGQDIADVAYSTVVIADPSRPYVETPATPGEDWQVLTSISGGNEWRFHAPPYL